MPRTTPRCAERLFVERQALYERPRSYVHGWEAIGPEWEWERVVGVLEGNRNGG